MVGNIHPVASGEDDLHGVVDLEFHEAAQDEGAANPNEGDLRLGQTGTVGEPHDVVERELQHDEGELIISHPLQFPHESFLRDIGGEFGDRPLALNREDILIPPHRVVARLQGADVHPGARLASPEGPAVLLPCVLDDRKTLFVLHSSTSLLWVIHPLVLPQNRLGVEYREILGPILKAVRGTQSLAFPVCCVAQQLHVPSSELPLIFILKPSNRS